MSRHGMDPDLRKATEGHLRTIPPDDASRAVQWLERGSLLGAALKRLLPRPRGAQEPRHDSPRGPSGIPAD